jgi:secreted PhoX family phosphatase
LQEKPMIGRAINHRVSRRKMLTATMLGAAAASTTALQASAQQKLAQGDANYQTTPKGDQHCGICFNFQPPNGCKFVQGIISPGGWCQLFAPKG